MLMFVEPPRSRQLLVVYAKGLCFSYSYSIKLDWYKLRGTSYEVQVSPSDSLLQHQHPRFPNFFHFKLLYRPSPGFESGIKDS